MNGSSSEFEKREFAKFKQWLFNLNREELLFSMQFSFETSSDTGESHELDLLKDMVKLQTPPETPVHPRAIGFKPRSQYGPKLDHDRGTEKSRWTRPRLFQWTERQSYRPTKGRRRGKQQRRFEVIARKKIAPWGEVYSLGCTRDQLEQDRRILEGTFIEQSQENGQQALFRDKSSAQSIVRMLQIVSRGSFLKSRAHSSISFCSDWLQPTERWFSLSFYMASRFQVSLWESFAQRGKSKSANVQPRIDYESNILQVAIPSAVRTGLRTAIELDGQNLDYLRDSLLWNVLSTHCATYDGDEWSEIWKSWREINLLYINQPIFKLQNLVRNSLNHTLVQEMEKSLLEEPPTDWPRRTKAKSKKKKNKKKKKRAEAAPLQDETIHTTETLSDEEKISEANIIIPLIDFPDNQTSAHERNRNIIFALTLLDEVIEDVFETVGLEGTPDVFEQEQKSAEPKRKETYFRGLERKNPKKSAFQVPNINGTDHKRSVQVPKAPDQWPLTSSINKDTVPRDIMKTNSSLPNDFYHTPIGLEDFTFGRTDEEDVLDGWPFANRYQSRKHSILTDFFQSQKEEDKADDDNDQDDNDEKLMAASTAASISSSTYIESTIVIEGEETERNPHDETANAADMLPIKEDETSIQPQKSMEEKDSRSASAKSSVSSVESNLEIQSEHESNEEGLHENGQEERSAVLASLNQDCRSPSPQAPITPPPTLSPILLSLADLKDLKRLQLTPENRTKNSINNITRTLSDAPLPGSLPSSPVRKDKNSLSARWSREDLRIAPFRDDHSFRPRLRQPQALRAVDFQPSYKSAALKSLAKPITSLKSATVDFRSRVLESSKRDKQRDSCAQSETAVDGQREDHHDFVNKFFFKDETTTITSAITQREPEDITTIREERNSFRDMCLTLGAEVARLKAMLAAQTASAVAAPFDNPDSFDHPVHRPGSFDPTGMTPFFHGMKRGQRVGAMSDAGLPRFGDHESQVSEDEIYDAMSKARNDPARQLSTTATFAESDASIEFNSVVQVGPLGKVPPFDISTVNGLQSRLTKDILRFLNATKTQLTKLDVKREIAIERFSRLVNTLWPRAQVKLYGSHESGLCLPSSDLDFVICLPAVHKNAPALAPGVLEGRNAINESSQKLLARELKGESWIDPRSIKLIERTVVPVIKVSTKDTKSRMIQLDISFDSPEHHGLEAVEMVRKILDELPLIRPLMLVLKQFLLDRGLLTAYTGGLSSYCLFLMLARYLQEQPSSHGDCGSLLMGFLDFYGNYFDPRVTGISVRRKQYFIRPNYASATYQRTGQGLWAPPTQSTPTHQQQHANPTSTSTNRIFLRRNSVSDTGSVDDVRRGQRQRRLSLSHRYVNHNVPQSDEEMHGRPFTFDPLFVEDPLSSRNNVGRNAFRIFQVQRAFSDAHRALVASLEWDMHSLNDDVDYPLLKCLLHGEDVLYEL